MPHKNPADRQAYERSKRKGRKLSRTWMGIVRCADCGFTASGSKMPGSGEGPRLGVLAARHAGRTDHIVVLERRELVVFGRK